MSTEHDDNGPAFPSPTEMYDGKTRGAVRGMTLRDYFAAKAMQVALVELWDQSKRDGRLHEGPVYDLAAKFGYETADAMLKARKA